MQTAQASNSSASSSDVAPDRVWTVRAAIRHSRRLSRAVALLAIGAAAVSTLDARIAFATALTLAALVPAALVDVIERRLPNRLVASAALIGLGSLVLERLVSDLAVTPRDVGLGALAMAGPLLVAHLVSPTAMGFGDVKVGVVAGAALGVSDPALGLVALALSSFGAALFGLLRHRRTLPFGPALVGGAIVTILFAASPLDPFGGVLR